MPGRSFARPKGRGYGLDHVGTHERIALDRKRWTRRFSDPVAAAFGAVLSLAGPLRRPSVDADHTDLPALAIGICGDQTIERILRGHPLGEQIEQLGTIFGARAPLRRHGANAGAYPRNDVADARVSRCHGNTGLTRVGIDRDDRKRLELERRSPFRWLLSQHRRGEKEKNEACQHSHVDAPGCCRSSRASYFSALK